MLSQAPHVDVWLIGGVCDRGQWGRVVGGGQESLGVVGAVKAWQAAFQDLAPHATTWIIGEARCNKDAQWKRLVSMILE